MAARLPEVHADGRQRDLRGARRHRRELGDPRRRGDVRPGPLLRALHHQRRHARRRLPHARHPRLHPRGHQLARARRHRLRVRGQRAGGRGGVPAPPQVLGRPRGVRGRARGPGVAPRQRDRGLLRRQLRRLLRRPAACPGDRQARARQGLPALPHQRRPRAALPHPRVQGWRALLQGHRRLLPPPARGGRGHASGPGGHGVVRDRQRQAAVLALHVRGQVGEPPPGARRRRRELQRPGADPGHGHGRPGLRR